MKQENRNRLIGTLRSHGLSISDYCKKVGMARSTFTAKTNTEKKPEFTCSDISAFEKLTSCTPEELYEIFIKED